MPRQSRNSQSAAAWNLDASTLQDADLSTQLPDHGGSNVSALLNTSLPSSSSSPATALRRSRLLHHHSQYALQPSLVLNAQGLPVPAEESRIWQARASVASSISQSSFASASGSTSGEVATGTANGHDAVTLDAPTSGRRRQSNNIRIVSSDSDSSIEVLPARTTARSRHTGHADGLAPTENAGDNVQEGASYEHASLSQSVSMRRRRPLPARPSPPIAAANAEDHDDGDDVVYSHRPTSARRAARAARSTGGGAAERARDRLLSLTESTVDTDTAAAGPSSRTIEDLDASADTGSRGSTAQRSRQQTARQAARRRSSARAAARNASTTSRSGDHELDLDMASHPSASGFDEDSQLTHEHTQRTDDMVQMTSEMQHDDMTQDQTAPYDDDDDGSSLPGGVPRGAAVHNDVDSLAGASPDEVETRALELLDWSAIGEDKPLPRVDHERWNRIGPAHITEGTPENDEVKAIQATLLEAVAELDAPNWMYDEPTPFLHPSATTSRSIGLTGLASIAGQSTTNAAINAWADDAYNPYSTFLPRAPALEGSFPSPTRIHRALGIERGVSDIANGDNSRSHVLASATGALDLSFLEVHARELRTQYSHTAPQRTNASRLGNVIVV